jgi:Nucleotidyl transferase AbiEii toxin, Type IV TA system
VTAAGFAEFLEQSEEERAAVFETAAANLGTTGPFIEKDFWVCLVIDLLFNRLPAGHPEMCFKGGTSLSKVHHLIRRFSEDIDVTLDPVPLGFSGERALDNPDLSTKKRGKLCESLHTTLLDYAQNNLAPALASVAERFNLGLEIEDVGDGNINLLVFYPALIDEGSPEYVPKRVTIELGARTAREPSAPCPLAPYIAELGLDFDVGVASIPTIDAERTFWEKVLILHGRRSGFDGEKRIPEDRHKVSRHYYDVAQIADTDVADNALANLELLESARKQELLLFRVAWKRIEKAQPGTFRIVPIEELRAAVKRDYDQMRAMVLGEAPEFAAVVDSLERLEGRLNALPTS